ncbi:MAG: hypothetical protein QXM16_00020 [Nitrososphaerota archaeon]
MGTFERFARKYFEESLKDLERAKRAFKVEDYPQAVFLCPTIGGEGC